MFFSSKSVSARQTAFVLGMGLATTVLSTMAPTALAQGIGQSKTIEIIEVTSPRPSKTAPSADEARERLKKIPGGIGLVESDVYLDDFAQSIGDALLFTPGVFADTSAQRETRISIRGSGLNSTFERRGITVRRDGVPISRASGTTEFQEVDPLTIDYLEVFKGANGLRYGAASLGGAINIVSPTGRNRDEGVTFRAEGGSFGTARASGTVVMAGDKWDFYSGLTALHSNGYREQSDVESIYSHTNIGYEFDNGVETRFYFTALSDNFELAGALTFEDALNNPRSTSRPVTIGPFFPGGPVTVLDPGPIEDDWDRNLDVFRISNKTTYQMGTTTLEGGFWYAYRNLDHAITRFAGIIRQEEEEIGGFFRLEGDFLIGEKRADWILGGEIAASTNDARTVENLFGQPGDLRTQSDQDARMITLYGQLTWPLADTLNAVVGFQYLEALRDVEAQVNTTSGRLVRDQFSPRFGLLWDANETIQVYTNVSQSFEPASTTDLTAGGVLDFTPLDVQQAWTVELGTRGIAGPFAWDFSVYRSWVEGEFIDLVQPGFNGFVSATFNADDTVHQGIELGLDVDLTPKSIADLKGSLKWRNTYTFNDFFFTSDPQDLNGAFFAFDGNRLAGVPEHVYVSELQLAMPRWYFTANLRWLPEGQFADFANTFKVDGYTLLGFTAGYEVTEAIRLFGSLENVTDERYISNVSTVANQSLQNDNIFTPGQGFAAYAGINVVF